MSVVGRLFEKGIAKPPKWLPGNIVYETQMGSIAYGTATDFSDVDVYGFCIPPKDMIFPHLRGEIPGFGTQVKRFEQYQEHHLKEEKKEYDVAIYSLIKYMSLLMENNPNILDSIFTRHDCVLHSTKIGMMIRDKRRDFLHKGSYSKLRGYCYSQLAKLSANKAIGKRKELVETYGYDTKYACHVVRLLLQAEQILAEHDLDLTRNKDQLKSIRRGEWTEEEVRRWAADKEKNLEELYHKSTLPWGPDEPKVKALLLDCLEEHYGNIGECVVDVDAAVVALRNIAAEIEKVKYITA